jgi:hypothetical protein
MEQLLQTISRSDIFSLLDGFSGYNQVLVSEEDRLKTTFQTKWGTFSYKCMPFWDDKCRSYFPEGHGCSLQRIDKQMCSGLPR